jgi:hypothetical protein
MKNVYFAEIAQKFREFHIEQEKDNKFTCTIIITNTTDQKVTDEVPGEKATQLISNIELNPEDIVILQKFMNVLSNFMLDLYRRPAKSLIFRVSRKYVSFLVLVKL